MIDPRKCARVEQRLHVNYRALSLPNSFNIFNKM